MPIAITCPICGSKIKAKDGSDGKSATCPKCGESVAVPANPPLRRRPNPSQGGAAEPPASQADGLDDGFAEAFMMEALAPAEGWRSERPDKPPEPVPPSH